MGAEFGQGIFKLMSKALHWFLEVGESDKGDQLTCWWFQSLQNAECRILDLEFSTDDSDFWRAIHFLWINQR